MLISNNMYLIEFPNFSLLVEMSQLPHSVKLVEMSNFPVSKDHIPHNQHKSWKRGGRTKCIKFVFLLKSKCWPPDCESNPGTSSARGPHICTPKDILHYAAKYVCFQLLISFLAWEFRLGWQHIGNVDIHTSI